MYNNILIYGVINLPEKQEATYFSSKGDGGSEKNWKPLV